MTDDTSTKALLSKAAILWERANDLAGTWNTGDCDLAVNDSVHELSSISSHSDMTSEESAIFRSAFSELDKRIESVRRLLTPPSKLVNRTPAKLRTLFLAHNMIPAAVLELHGKFAKDNARSKQKVLSAAETIFRMVSTTHLGSTTQFINPIMGVSRGVHVNGHCGLS